MQNPLTIMRIRDHGNPHHAFGWVRNGGTKPHQGWDLEAAPGTAAFAISKGTVEFIADSGNAGYGRQLCLAFSFQGRKHFAFYAHLQEVKVKQKQEVAEGYTIALTGRSGNAANLPASQWHLHFEIRTIAQIPGGQGLFGRIDPGIVLGYQVLSCH